MNDQTNTLERRRAAAWVATIEAFDGDVELAACWLNQPIQILGNERPGDFMDSLERIRILRAVIAKLEHGFP